MEKAYEICIEMFEQRGYDIIEKDDDQILAMKKNGKQICAFMANTPKFKKSCGCPSASAAQVADAIFPKTFIMALASPPVPALAAVNMVRYVLIKGWPT